MSSSRKNLKKKESERTISKRARTEIDDSVSESASRSVSNVFEGI
jgi:hypothetical protein